jgi:serine/threonine protein kinase/tetratricopeptide (TPR) repeat protein
MNNSLPPTTSALPADVVPVGLTRLGHYELLDCIGRGGMGLVYRARDTRLDRQVAIKCLRTELFEAHYVERFKREALLLAKLNHPNIVQIYDFIEAPDQLALVMELVEGQNLQLHLREHIVPFSQRMRWLTEIAQGLAVAHDAGIIHRDLKAENILINQRKVAKITDLGIAKSQDFNVTLTDHVAGSYCSMSPEQAMGEAIDFKSDLFSFGILAYQLLCGAHPFGDTNNKLQLMQRIISHPPVAPGKHNPDLPAEINDLLGQLLSKDPAKRPDNTHWVAAQLETLSHLQPANDFASDDTQVLIPGGSAANQAHVKSTGIASAVRTQDHPTFETRFVAINTAQKKSHWLPIKNYLIENKISVGFGLFSVLILAAVVIWQLQPKPPKYIAVIPPKLTSEGMQESQQELVKGAVYDAIQQSVIQLDGYYLIPRDEIADAYGDNETVRKATAADELISADIQCGAEACSITLSRLLPETKESTSRLRVESTKNFDILVDSYLSVVEIVQHSVGSIYNERIMANNKSMNERDYAIFLESTQAYNQNGANDDLLSTLNPLLLFNKETPSALQTLFNDISLDLYHQTKNPDYLLTLESLLSNPSIRATTAYYQNLFYLQIAQEKFFEAEKTISMISLKTSSSFTTNELMAYLMMAKQDYLKANYFYERALAHRKTSNIFYFISLANWYQGKNMKAKEYATEALKLSPRSAKAHSLKGVIHLIDGEIEEAKTSFDEIASQNANDPINLSNIGICHLLQHDYEKAYNYFDSASQIAPNNLLFVLNKADAKNLAGKISEAHFLYSKIIGHHSDPTTDNLRHITQAYAHLGKFSEALTSLKKLEKFDESNIETTYTAALVHTLANNHESALLYIKNAIDSGMSEQWFSFSWFDSLCVSKNFGLIVNKKGTQDRCPHNAY